MVRKGTHKNIFLAETYKKEDICPFLALNPAGCPMDYERINDYRAKILFSICRENYRFCKYYIWIKSGNKANI